MINDEFVKEVKNLPHMRHDEIFALTEEPQFKEWFTKELADGCSCTDEWLLYQGQDEIARELGSRLSWLGTIATDKEINVSEPDDYFPTFAQPFELYGDKYWLLTVVGQGAVSWIMSDIKFHEEFKRNTGEE